MADLVFGSCLGMKLACAGQLRHAKQQVQRGKDGPGRQRLCTDLFLAYNAASGMTPTTVLSREVTFL